MAKLNGVNTTIGQMKVRGHTPALPVVKPKRTPPARRRAARRTR